jgi:hypothetical protein
MEDLNLQALLKEFSAYLEDNGYAIIAYASEIDFVIQEFLELKT